MIPRMNGQELKIQPQVSNQQILDHLGSVLSAPAFASSKRCQDFLRYIVSEAIEGRRDEINERSIAHLVFGKSQRFEPSEDSLVRVKAHEVRRRLEQYYRENPTSAVRLEIPAGGYAPNFIRQQPQAQPDLRLEGLPPPPQPLQPRVSRRKVLWSLGGVAAVAGVAVPAVRYFSAPHALTPLELLWQPVAEAKAPLLISVPVLSTKTLHGTISDRVGIGVAAAISQAANFLDAHRIPYRLRFGSGLTFAQLREQPSLLLGGFTSSWSLWATKGLRYTLVAGNEWPDSYIQDSESGQKWQAENLKPDGYATADYAIVARLFNALNGQMLFVAAGITTFGTEGAASVLFDPRAFDQLVRGVPDSWASRSFEAIVKVSIFDTTPSAPEIVAKRFW